MKTFKIWLETVGVINSTEEALQFLKLSPGATKEQVQKAIRKLAQEYHPDRGGDIISMKKLTAAMDWFHDNDYNTTQNAYKDDDDYNYEDRHSYDSNMTGRPSPVRSNDTASSNEEYYQQGLEDAEKGIYKCKPGGQTQTNAYRVGLYVWGWLDGKGDNSVITPLQWMGTESVKNFPHKIPYMSDEDIENKWKDRTDRNRIKSIRKTHYGK